MVSSVFIYLLSIHDFLRNVLRSFDHWLFISIYCIYVYVHMHVAAHTGQRTTYKCGFSSFTTLVSWVRHSGSVLAIGLIICWVTLPHNIFILFNCFDFFFLDDGPHTRSIACKYLLPFQRLFLNSQFSFLFALFYCSLVLKTHLVNVTSGFAF